MTYQEYKEKFEELTKLYIDSISLDKEMNVSVDLTNFINTVHDSNLSLTDKSKILKEVYFFCSSNCINLIDSEEEEDEYENDQEYDESYEESYDTSYDDDEY